MFFNCLVLIMIMLNLKCQGDGNLWRVVGARRVFLVHTYVQFPS